MSLKQKFPLSSEQLELLLAFEHTQSLAKLAEFMGRDQSVISRQIQKLAEDRPVIKKVNGKWAITPLGIKINELTLKALTEYEKSFEGQTLTEINFKNTALIIVNAQKALLKSLHERSNPLAEKNIESLLSHWRKKGNEVIHVQHLSEKPSSPFHQSSPESDFIKELSPVDGEISIQKFNSSSFAGTKLKEILEEKNITTIILAGFTANDCIEASAKESSELGFNTYVVEDATAMFDFVSPASKLYKAEKIHELVMANIALRFGKIEKTNLFLV